MTSTTAPRPSASVRAALRKNPGERAIERSAARRSRPIRRRYQQDTFRRVSGPNHRQSITRVFTRGTRLARYGQPALPCFDRAGFGRILHRSCARCSSSVRFPWQAIGVAPTDWKNCAIDEAFGEADAGRRLRTSAYDVIVTSPSTPAARDLAMVKEARHQQPGIRTVVIAPELTAVGHHHRTPHRGLCVLCDAGRARRAA